MSNTSAENPDGGVGVAGGKGVSGGLPAKPARAIVRSGPNANKLPVAWARRLIGGGCKSLSCIVTRHLECLRGDEGCACLCHQRFQPSLP